MKQVVEMKVELCDNGIVLTWKGEEITKMVALKGTEEACIGNCIWDDIFNMSDKDCSCEVRMKIEYETIK